jgi:hypothetical protein
MSVSFYYVFQLLQLGAIDMHFNIGSDFLIRAGKQAGPGRLRGWTLCNGADNFYLWQSQHEDWSELDVDHTVRHPTLFHS